MELVDLVGYQSEAYHSSLTRYFTSTKTRVRVGTRSFWCL